MPTPSFSSQHIDVPLTNISVAYMQAQKNYIAQQVFPAIPVEKASAKYFTYPKGDWLRDEAKKRADATESAGGGYHVSTDNYNADVWAFHKDVGDQVLQNYTNPLDPIRDATRYVASRLMLRQEVDFAQKYFKAGVWSNDWAGVASAPSGNQVYQWSDYTNSTPIVDVSVWATAIQSVTGFDPNVLVIGKQVFDKLKSHPEIIDRIKYTGRDIPTPELLASLFDVEKVLVAKSLVNTAVEGQTDAISYNFGKGAMLVYANPEPGLLTPSAGYTFVWNGVSDGFGLNVGTKQFRMEERAAQRIESQVAWANKVVATDLGLFATTLVA